MEILAYTIEHKSDIDRCPPLVLLHQQWTCRYAPETTARVACLKDRGLFVKMHCREKDPKRLCRNPQDMVCKDSAVEAFFAFETKQGPISYFNLEVNANGVMHAAYGASREGRIYLTDDEYKKTGVHAEIAATYWTAEFLLPFSIIEKYTGSDPLDNQGNCKPFSLNFYKISEDPSIEHYLSFSRIDRPKPDFHQPSFFATAQVISHCPDL